STLPTSGFGAPLRTNTATPTFARSVRLPDVTLPDFSSASICAPETITTSANSPRWTRAVISPIAALKSTTTRWPEALSNPGTSSFITGSIAEPPTILSSAAPARLLSEKRTEAAAMRRSGKLMRSWAPFEVAADGNVDDRAVHVGILAEGRHRAALHRHRLTEMAGRQRLDVLLHR